MVASLIALSLAFATVGFTRGHTHTRNDRAAYQRAHRAAVKQRRRADDLQHRLTRRVLENHSLRRSLTHRQSSQEALRLAAITYEVSYAKLLHVALCETGGTLSRYSKNRASSASGLFQFLYPSTWQSTPFGAESVWSPYASALAAGWMFSHGRGGEWVCQ